MRPATVPFLLLLANLPLSGCDQSRNACELLLRIHLSRFKDGSSLADTQAVVQIRVEADDLAEPVSASWAGPADGSPSLELSVPAGDDRRLVLVAFVDNEERVVTYRGLVEHLNLEPGTRQVDVEAAPAPTWTLDLLVVGGRDIRDLSVLDVETGTIWPAQPAKPGSDGAHATFDDLPVGRFFYLLYRTAGETDWAEPADFCPLYSGQAASRYEVLDLETRSCGSGG